MNQLTINSEKQNKPTLIVKDFESYGIQKNITYDILLRRGVFKWFAVRRRLIKYKNELKWQITSIIENLKEQKKIPNNTYMVGFLRGYLKAKEEDRMNIRIFCHSSRWQAPDFDRGANEYLNSVKENEQIDYWNSGAREGYVLGKDAK